MRKKKKGSIKGSVPLATTQTTAGLSGWGEDWQGGQPAEGRAKLNNAAIHMHRSAAFRTPPAHSSFALQQHRGFGQQTWDGKLSCKEVWAFVCSEWWGKASSKNVTTAHVQLSKFLKHGAPALRYNSRCREGVVNILPV